MRERPIIFNSEMVRAVMEGRKVQTRRIIKLDHERGMQNPVVRGKCGAVSYVGCRLAANLCPFGAVGDRLWVRETWSEDFANYYPNDRVWYAADDDRRLDIEVVDGVRGIFSPESDVHVPFRWRPSIHIPRWASRITLEITGVRVERLQDISEADCAAEGLGSPFLRDYKKPKFAALWQSIYGEESWQANPWVWVIEFKRVEGE
ncbi:hypothetical protein PRCB_16380 [Pantoea rodasii]|uniref:Morphogenetic protein n=1 Tax=Pantoea rodasii TaxID=1076549 RepID=A0A2M9WBS3_9GAMM|nr:hypothetical protein [Pantoea rodasii]ORM64509.1 hypothetical protein HA45_09050 [Pantoea rodasii]PJZ04979.1 hypothetical protein PRCB_16380 [Pantoea rodasii]